MSRLVLRIVVLAALLWGGTALSVSAQGRLMERLGTGTSLGKVLQKHVPALLLAGGVLLGTLQLPAQAQMSNVTEEQVWTEEMSQETYNSVFYMSTSQEDNPTIRHALYIGDTDEGEHLFAGLYMYFLEPYQGDLRFYASDGQLLAEGVSRTDVKVFPDPFNDFNVVNLFTIEGLKLEETPTPIVAAPYPIEEFGKELNMVAYLSAPDAPDGVFNLVRRQRDCQVVDPRGWLAVGIGMSSCAPPPDIAHSLNGAAIFDADSGELVGFYGEHVQGVHVVLQNAEFAEYSSGQSSVITAVDSKGKLSTTWAAIKAKH